MPGPQTQHKGTVYGDDENAPKPGLGPPVRRRPQHAHRRTSCSHPPRGMTAPRARSARRLTYLLTYLKAGSKRDKLCVMLESPLLSPPFPALWEIRSQPSAVGPVAKVSADRRSTPRPIAPPDANLSPALLQAALPNALLSRLCVLSAQPMPGLCASRSFAHNEARHPASLHGSTPARPHPASAPVPVTAALTASLI